MNLLSTFALLALFIYTVNATQFVQFEYGGMKATVVSDGPFQVCRGGFRVPDEQIEASFLSQQRRIRPVIVGLNVLVVDINGKRVLVDPGTKDISAFGFNNFVSAGRMLDSLNVAGITPESIDIIAMSHGIADHYTGMTTTDGERVFKNAVVYIAKDEYDFWQSPPNNTDSSFQANLIFSTIFKSTLAPYEAAGKIRLVRPDRKFISRGVVLQRYKGHTPGHSVVEFRRKNKTLIASGESWTTEPLQFDDPSIENVFTNDGPASVRSRLRLLNRLSRKRILTVSYHNNFPGVGYVVKQSAKKFKWFDASMEELASDLDLIC